MEGGIVEKHAVRLFTVIAERLSVICRDDDDRVGTGRLNHASGRAIGRRDFPVVGRRGEPPLQIWRRIVRVVRVEQVNPGEERGAGC